MSKKAITQPRRSVLITAIFSRRPQTLRAVLLVILVLTILLLGSVALYRSVLARNLNSKLASGVTPKQQESLAISSMRYRYYTPSKVNVERTIQSDHIKTVQVISYYSDGLKIYGLLTKPSSTPPPGGWPVVILGHGYIIPSEYQTTGTDYQHWTDGLVGAGMMVIKPDYRGHGSSEGTPEGGYWSPAYSYDVLNLVTNLAKIESANPARVGLMGHSMGAAVALRAAVTNNQIKATVLLAGVVADAEDIMGNWRPASDWHPPSNMPNNKQRLIDKYGLPKDNPDFWSRVSPINYVSYISGPVQIHHGTNDEIVPKTFSDSLASALQKSGKTYEYIEYQGGNHQFSSNSNAALQSMTRFFIDNL